MVFHFSNPFINLATLDDLEVVLKVNDLINQIQTVQQDRAKEYNKEEERSFSNIAVAFNAITHRPNYLQGSDIALILQILKDVRLYANPETVHKDSLIDKPSYALLHCEEFYKERNP